MHSHNGRIRPGGSLLILVLLLSLVAAAQSFGDGIPVEPPIAIHGLTEDSTVVGDSLAGPDAQSDPDVYGLFWIALQIVTMTL